jgi:hypothetical protein
MVGQYVHMVADPNRIGTVKAARFDKDHALFLFQQDPRIEWTFPDVWLEESELEVCARPADEQVAWINDLTLRNY